MKAEKEKIMPTAEEWAKLNKLNADKTAREIPLLSELRSIELAKEEILKSFYSVRIARFADRYKAFLEIFLFVAFAMSLLSVMIVFARLKIGEAMSQLIFFGGLICTLFLCSQVKKYRNLRSRVEIRAFRRARKQITELDKRRQAALASMQIVSEWYDRELERMYEDWATYPPDWENRKEKVLERDRYACTKCGWPNGVQRYTRELHVHHKRAISEGGSHDISNLTTLCNDCHRKVNAAHSFVKKNSRTHGHLKAMRSQVQTDEFIKQLNEMSPSEREEIMALLEAQQKSEH